MTAVHIELPDWISEVRFEGPMTDSAIMNFVVELAGLNIEAETGGPFAAAVFGQKGLIAAGVNVVVPNNVAIAHAEAMAVALAGQRLGSYDVGASGPATLYSSAEPCVMCLGVTVWSGVERLVCAARDEDARAIGFDEGPKPSDWRIQLQNRGIDVVTDISRVEARAILNRYAEKGGAIYNADSRRI